MKLLIAIFSTLIFTTTAFALEHSKYDQIVGHIQSVNQQYPADTEVFELGLSDSGKMIVGMKIGHGPLNNLLAATHHGNEYGSTEVAKAFISDLAAKPIPNQTIWIIPVLNISGYNSGNRHEQANGGSYDPNRDYPGPCGTDGPWNLKSTRALAELMEKVPFVTTATLHTFAAAVLYPWGISTEQTETLYDNMFINLGNFAAATSGYDVGNSTLLLYPADGTFEDYSFWKHGAWSLLFEMGYSHSPSTQAVQELVRVNVPGLRAMFENSPAERAEDHEFHGQCSLMSRVMDMRNE